jgi:hypothetical protein
MTDQRHVVVAELHAAAQNHAVAAARLDAEQYPGEGMASQSRRYRKAKALHEKADFYHTVAQFAAGMAQLKPGDSYTISIPAEKGEADGST